MQKYANEKECFTKNDLPTATVAGNAGCFDLKRY